MKMTLLNKIMKGVAVTAGLITLFSGSCNVARYNHQKEKQKLYANCTESKTLVDSINASNPIYNFLDGSSGASFAAKKYIESYCKNIFD